MTREASLKLVGMVERLVASGREVRAALQDVETSYAVSAEDMRRIRMCIGEKKSVARSATGSRSYNTARSYSR